MRAVPANRYIVFLLIAAVGCLADLATKHWAFAQFGLPGGPTYWIWQDVLGIQTSLNEGALFGMGQGMVVLFSLLSIVAALGILFWLFVAGAARDWLLTVALGCVLAGISGNLYDRLGMPGLRWNYANALHDVNEPVYAVRDWILVMIGSWPWPTFNLADSLLVCGAGMLFWHALRHDARGMSAESAPSANDLPASGDS